MQQPAGFWIRLFAYFIDWLLILALVSIALALGPEAARTAFSTIDPERWTRVDAALCVLFVAYTTTTVATWARTAGKAAAGLVVVRPDGASIGLGRSFVRSLAVFLSGAIIFIGFLMIAFRRDKRSLHDLICDTVVIHSVKPGVG